MKTSVSLWVLGMMSGATGVDDTIEVERNALSNKHRWLAIIMNSNVCV